MKVIKGESLQSYCDISLSKVLHKEYEKLDIPNSLDIDTYDFKDYDNPYIVYINASLFNQSKPTILESGLYSKLLQFKNPFIIVATNGDQNFEIQHKKFLEIPNCERIYSIHVNYKHPKLQPIPLGIGNISFRYGREEEFYQVLNADVQKTELIYFNFLLEGGARADYRPQCATVFESKGLKMLPNKSQLEYLYSLKAHKFSICPPGNALDTHRMWESLYFKTVPICLKSPLTEYFSKIFPIYEVESWDDVNIESLDKLYETFDWSNYNLLDITNYKKRFLW